jgi:Fic family protein
MPETAAAEGIEGCSFDKICDPRRKAAFWNKYREISMNDRQIKMVNLLWDGFEGKLTSSKWGKITKCSADTALRDIQALIAKGILRKTDEGGRSTHYELIF